MAKIKLKTWLSVSTLLATLFAATMTALGLIQMGKEIDACSFIAIVILYTVVVMVLTQFLDCSPLDISSNGDE